MPTQFACSTAGFRATSIDEALAEIREAGFTALDLATIPGFCDHFNVVNASGAERDDFVRLVRHHGFSVASITCALGRLDTHAPDFLFTMHAAGANLKLAAQLDARSLSLRLEGESDAAIIGLKRIAREAARLNLDINVEVEPRDLISAAAMLHNIAESNVWLALNLARMRTAQLKPEQEILRFAEKIGFVRISDEAGDLKESFEALERVGYSGYCSIELQTTCSSLSDGQLELRRVMQHVCSQTTW